MHRSIPSANKILTERWNKRTHEMHKKKLSTIRPGIDNTRPKSHVHLHLKLKKLQQEEERLTQIEHDNRLLLQKMSTIMRKKNTLDNQNKDFLKSSLNRGYRKRELQRITAENQGILRRIQTAQPTYNHVKWEQERDQNEAYLRNKCEFPPIGPSRPRRQVLSPDELREIEKLRRDEEETKIKEALASRPKKGETFHQRRPGTTGSRSRYTDEEEREMSRGSRRGEGPAAARDEYSGGGADAYGESDGAGRGGETGRSEMSGPPAGSRVEF